jgi:hypothetical protein
MATGRTSGAAQTIDVRAAVLSPPELKSSGGLMPAPAAVGVLSHGGPHTPTGFNWRLKGDVSPQSALMAAATQVGRIAGYGSPVRTDSKFSSSMGPPSCSPPV